MCHPIRYHDILDTNTVLLSLIRINSALAWQQSLHTVQLIRLMTNGTSDRNEPLSVALVRSIAELADRDVSSLPPLYESIDPDALERLFEPTATGPRAGSIEFRYPVIS